MKFRKRSRIDEAVDGTVESLVGTRENYERTRYVLESIMTKTGVEGNYAYVPRLEKWDFKEARCVGKMERARPER